MDKKEAIEYLKQRLGEIPELTQLAHNNDKYPLWYRIIEDVLEEVFGRDSSEYERFSGAWLHVSAGEHQREYITTLKMRETALKSIIQKYETLGFKTEPETLEVLLPKAFISHGKKSVALNKLEEFLRALGVEPLVVKEQPSLDKTVDDKVNYYLNQANFVIILATGDDKIEGKLHPRQNVIHEIGLAQKTHAGKIIYLLEEGTEFPSNISPKVWEPFKQRNMMNAFLHIAKELRAYGMLKTAKV
jgi:predicted nucleotide-binding protein